MDAEAEVAIVRGEDGGERVEEEAGVVEGDVELVGEGLVAAVVVGDEGIGVALEETVLDGG